MPSAQSLQELPFLSTASREYNSHLKVLQKPSSCDITPEGVFLALKGKSLVELNFPMKNSMADFVFAC